LAFRFGAAALRLAFFFHLAATVLSFDLIFRFEAAAFAFAFDLVRLFRPVFLAAILASPMKRWV